MSPKHSDPGYDDPRRDSKTGEKVWARAPYNFVRLPEKVVMVDLPPDQSIYSGFTGTITCEMVTRAPTYIRGMATRALMKKLSEMEQAEKERKAAGRRRTPAEKKDWDEQERQLKELHSAFFGLDDIPFIPGSSLRGMIRSLVEIITYSKIRWIGGMPTFAFRAVAAQNDDPLKQRYQGIMGSFGSNIRAGYLHQKGERWVIYPAKTPAEVGLPEKNGYIKVKEQVLLNNQLPGYLHLNHPEYQPQVIPVSFEADIRSGSRGDKFTAISKICPPDANLRYKGTLVCSGNMLETGKSGQMTRRKNQALILEPAPGKEIPVSQQAVEDYQLSLTTFQRENLTAWQGGEWGCLRDGAPVFFVWTGREKEVIYFGHSPNFRVPVRLPGSEHASNPLDFVPAELRAEDLMDCADAMFGWTPEPGGSTKDSCAGRVFFTDARLTGQPGEIWHSPQAITPHVLSGPKATTFQHYLAQDRGLGHNPDSKKELAHYGTPPNETQIRGRKYYWHRGSAPEIEANDKERQHESQLTRIQPVKAGVRFTFQIYFENLRDFELGALLWALQPRGGENEIYTHKIGMGKPLGMGAVQIEQARLTLTDRSGARYIRLFSDEQGSGWDEGVLASSAQDFTATFERFLLSATQGFYPNASRAADLPPIQDLLAMMAWRSDDPGPAWRDWTRYMEIERGTGRLNEFKERPVLPTPTEVTRWAAGTPSATGSHSAADTPFAGGPSAAGRPGRVVTEQPQAVWPPKKGAVLLGTVLDDEPRGSVYLSVTGADDAALNRWLQNNAGAIEIVAEIQPKHRAGKSYNEGEKNIRLIVMAAEKDSSGWLIQCRPVS